MLNFFKQSPNLINLSKLLSLVIVVYLKCESLYVMEGFSFHDSFLCYLSNLSMILSQFGVLLPVISFGSSFGVSFGIFGSLMLLIN